VANGGCKLSLDENQRKANEGAGLVETNLKKYEKSHGCTGNRGRQGPDPAQGGHWIRGGGKKVVRGLRKTGHRTIESGPRGGEALGS